MIKINNTYLGTMALVAIFIMQSCAANAQKIAFVNETKLLNATIGYTEAIKHVDSVKKALSEEIQMSQNKFQKTVADFWKPYNLSEGTSAEEAVAKLSANDKTKWELLQEESKLLTKQIELKQSEYEALYQDRVGVIVQKVQKVIDTYSAEKKIDMMYKIESIGPALAWYNKNFDVTDELIKRLK